MAELAFSEAGCSPSADWTEYEAGPEERMRGEEEGAEREGTYEDEPYHTATQAPAPFDP